MKTKENFFLEESKLTFAHFTVTKKNRGTKTKENFYRDQNQIIL